MRSSRFPYLFSVLGLGLFLAAAPGALEAQEEQQYQQQCTATVQPEEIPAGERATQVTFSLSGLEMVQPGIFTELEAPAESNIRLASAEDIPRQDMANPESTPRPIQMSNDQSNALFVWLNTSEASPGTYEVALHGGEMTCKAQITVSER